MKIYKVYYWVNHEGEFDTSYFLNKGDAEKATKITQKNSEETYVVGEIEVNEQYTSN